MLSDYRYLAFLTAFVFFSCAFAPNSYGDGYKGFKLLNPDECTPLKNKVISKLPVKWHKYADFIKICNLKQNKAASPEVSIISIWVDDYYKSLPAEAPWEEFPRPVIMDIKFKKIGELPILYPFDQPCDVDVYYGKWKRGVPFEIRVDVKNPAVEGDFYFEPIIWDEQSKSYVLKSREVKYGRRH